jgi:hypothetical protein
LKCRSEFYLGGRTFDPETVSKISEAFQSVCDALGLKAVDDAVTRLVAEKIIGLTEGGISDAAALHVLTLKSFQPSDASS